MFRKLTRRTAVCGVFLLLAIPHLLLAGENQVSGTIQNEAGSPVEGATVTITSPTAATFRRTAETDRKGHFALTLGPAAWEYAIRIEKAGFTPTLSQFRVPIGRPILSLSATLHPAVSPPPSPGPAPDSGTASAANPNSPEALYSSGLELIKAKDYHGAAAAFARVTQLKRDWADPYYWFAVCQLNRKRYTESRASLQRYLELAPQGSQAAAARDMLKTMPEK